MTHGGRGAQAGGVGGAAAVAAPQADGGSLRLTAAELAQWQQATATPEQRQQLVAGLQAAFAGVATVGSGPVPGAGGSQGAGVVSASYTGTGQGGQVEQALSTGVTGTHFWVIASYADIVHGAIGVAVKACYRWAPGWLCNGVGSLLTGWANGWGAASNHGVWGAVYWAPPHLDGGRW
ncbi:hypothetical protein GCM10009760_15950 [Kitasatospora kazusensis]|uniref:Uncharacterized protein n=1 Tax=Kitasatospora kazusensis TaxID=407974 RepID=A0ABN2Z431_9ACTN